MIGNNADPVSGSELPIRFAQVNEAVLFIHLGEDSLGRFDDMAETDFRSRRWAIGGEGLRAAVDNYLARFCRRDHRDQDRCGALVERAGAGENGVPVIKYVGPGADFVQAGEDASETVSA